MQRREGGNVNGFELDAAEMIRRMGKWTLIAGIVQIVLGVFALLLVGVTTVVTVAVIAAIVCITGVIDVVDFFANVRARRSWWKLARGLLFAMSGPVMLLRPEMAVAALTLVIGMAFLASGALRVVDAAVRRPPRWGWIVAGGAVSLLLGSLIMAQWPASSAWLIGVFVGIEMLFHGWSLVMHWLGFQNLGRAIAESSATA